ncbi:HutD family protein [Sphingomonas sp.]|uniref:HutD family protein n=1 Tax=Sphingomonas sp. TaxID=28214 RepID=UPI003422E5B4
MEFSPPLLRPAAQRAATPWKNGGGSTSEVIAWPPGADMESAIASPPSDPPLPAYPGTSRDAGLTR